jgi:hypothetical protein
MDFTNSLPDLFGALAREPVDGVGNRLVAVELLSHGLDGSGIDAGAHLRNAGLLTGIALRPHSTTKADQQHANDGERYPWWQEAEDGVEDLHPILPKPPSASIVKAPAIPSTGQWTRR